MEFNPYKVKCAKCDDIIYSRYPGEYRSCKCGAISVDQTEYYCRHIGQYSDHIFLDDNGEEESQPLL